MKTMIQILRRWCCELIRATGEQFGVFVTLNVLLLDIDSREDDGDLTTMRHNIACSAAFNSGSVRSDIREEGVGVAVMISPILLDLNHSRALVSCFSFQKRLCAERGSTVD